MIAKLRPTLGYLGRLQDRVEKQGFPPQDALLEVVRETRNEMQRLCMKLHYLTCKGQVGGE